MQLAFQKAEVTPDYVRLGITQLWEAEKFPFKIRIGLTARPSKPEVFYWTVLGTYIKPDVALLHGKSPKRLQAEDEATKALESLLVDLKDWVYYAKENL